MRPVGYRCTRRCVVEGFCVPPKHPGAGRPGGTGGTAQGDTWNCMEAITPSRNKMSGVAETGLNTNLTQWGKKGERGALSECAATLPLHHDASEQTSPFLQGCHPRPSKKTTRRCFPGQEDGVIALGTSSRSCGRGESGHAQSFPTL